MKILRPAASAGVLFLAVFLAGGSPAAAQNPPGAPAAGAGAAAQPAAPQAAPAAPAVPAALAAPVAPSAFSQRVQPLMRENISTYGPEVDNLFYLILVITLIALLAVEVLLVIFVIKYRHHEGRRARYTHGNNKLEVCWTVATAIVLIFLVFAQKETWDKIKKNLPAEGKDTYLVRVFAEQFEWHFVYPGKDGQFEPSTMEDIFPDNRLGLRKPENDVEKKVLVVPVNTKVVCQLNSLPKYDQNTKRETMPVLHSFFVPVLRFKQDVIPFHPAKIWFEATKVGTYEVDCAELCGLGHYQMGAVFQVLEDKDLNAALGYDWRAFPASFKSVETAALPPAAKALEKKPGD